MLLDPALTLVAPQRCFGCRARREWLCAACLDDLHRPIRVDPIEGVHRVAVPWAYEGAARDLILALKLRAHRPAASVLGRHLAAWIQSVGTGASAVTWVPGRKRDTRIRGFDHAELIGREVGRRLGLPVVRTLRRTGARPDQTTLSASERRVNLQGAFGPLDRAGPLGRYDKLLLVDDLVTTGATAAACARALKDGGTTHVEVAAPCRA